MFSEQMKEMGGWVSVQVGVTLMLLGHVAKDDGIINERYRVWRCDENPKKCCGNSSWNCDMRGEGAVSSHSTLFHSVGECACVTNDPVLLPRQGSSCRIQTARWVSSGSERRMLGFTPAPPATSEAVSSPQPLLGSLVRQPHTHKRTQTIIEITLKCIQACNLPLKLMYTKSACLKFLSICTASWLLMPIVV